MKNCDEITNNLLERRNQYLEERKRKRRNITRFTTAACSFVLVALIGIGIWQSGWLDGMQPTIPDNSNISEQNQNENNDKQTGNREMIGDNDQISNPNNMITLISSYGTDNPPITTIPKNGTVQLSTSLTNAIEHYGDDVEYSVVFELYRDEQLWDIDIENDTDLFKAEMYRLYELGYTPLMETQSENWGENGKFSIGIHASAEELENFVANTSYGYNVYLYDEIYA